MFRSCALLGLMLAAASADAAQNVVVVLDDSGSMDERMRSDRRLDKIEAAKQALIAVLQQLPADAKVGIVLLNGSRGRSKWVYPLGPVSQNQIRQAVRGIVADGNTPLGARIKDGADALLKLRDKEHYGSFRLLIVTDGEASDAHLVEEYLPDILTRGIWVDVIGVDMAGDHSLATQVHTYRKADDPASLEQAIREVFAESTSDPGDAVESDFEVLAAIPDEVAEAALTALSQSGNYPIGEAPPGLGQGPGESRPRPATPRRGTPSPAQTVSIGGGVCCVVFLVLFVLVVLLVIASSTQRRRRSERRRL